MTKILLAGDWHGNTSAARRAIDYALRHGCSKIVQLGDFGYWEHTSEGARYLWKLERMLGSADVELYFVDGNHDNHPLLWRMYPPLENGFSKVREQLFYCPRGHRWEWDGVRFLACGGAYSIDKDRRLASEHKLKKPRTRWWPTEMIRPEDIERSSLGGKVDVVFSHDCPAGVEIPGIHAMDKQIFPDSNMNREYLRRVVLNTKPRLICHGHYHVRYRSSLALPYEVNGRLEWHRVQVEGLDFETNAGALQILDLEMWRR